MGVKRIWTGEQPAPTDLLDELANPSQYRIAEHHLRLQQIAFPLDSETFAVDSFYVREPSTTVSFAEFLGVSGKEIEDQLARVDEQIIAAIAEASVSDE